MLTLALFFFVIALVSGLFGFTGLAAGAASIAKFLVLAKVLCVLFFVACLGMIFYRAGSAPRSH